MTESWHVPAVVLRAYAEDDVSDADAWSVEAHVARCSRCADALGGALAGTDAGALVAAVRLRLAGALPVQPRVPRATARRRAWVLATSGTGPRWAWLAAVVATVAGALVLAGAGDLGIAAAGDGTSVDGWWSTGALLLAVAPVLPLLGVALSYGALDPLDELVGSTASGGLRLLLWRTLAVLVVSLPALLVVGVAVGPTAPVLWLLPAVALTVLTLALGSVVALPTAALAVGGGWLVVVIGSAATAHRLVVLDPGLVPLWSVLALAGMAVVAVRRDAFVSRPARLSKEFS